MPYRDDGRVNATDTPSSTSNLMEEAESLLVVTNGFPQIAVQVHQDRVTRPFKAAPLCRTAIELRFMFHVMLSRH